MRRAHVGQAPAHEWPGICTNLGLASLPAPQQAPALGCNVAVRFGPTSTATLSAHLWHGCIGFGAHEVLIVAEQHGLWLEAGGAPWVQHRLLRGDALAWVCSIGGRGELFGPAVLHKWLLGSSGVGCCTGCRHFRVSPAPPTSPALCAPAASSCARRFVHSGDSPFGRQ